MFRNRSAIEIMVISFTMLLAFIVVLTGITIAVAKIKDPEADVDTAVSALTSIVASILSALLGLVAGKSEALQTSQKRPEEQGEFTVYERPDEHPHDPHDKPEDLGR
jgi:hypothetical protein